MNKKNFILFIDETKGSNQRSLEPYEVNKCSFKNCKNRPLFTNTQINKRLRNYYEEIIKNGPYSSLTPKQIYEYKKYIKKILLNKDHDSDICEEHFKEIFNNYFDIDVSEEFFQYLIKYCVDSLNIISSDEFNFLRKRYITNTIDVLTNNILSSCVKANNPNIKEILDEEIMLFTDNHFYVGLPNDWKLNCEIYEHIGKTAEQGKYNGPDFILRNVNDNRLIGVEVITINKNLYCSLNEKTANPKNIKKWYKFRDCHEYIEKIKEDILTKEDKVKKYKKCDEYNLVFVLNNSIMEWEYFLYNKYFKNFSKIFKNIIFC